MKLVFGILILLGLLICDSAVAEGGCPPGQYPQSGQGWQTCVPIPGNNQGTTQQGPPPAVWSTKWLAIASDNPKGILGTSVNRPSQADAEQSAIADCMTKGGSNCSVQISYRNGCVAMVVGDKVMNTNGAPTKEEAEDKGLSLCKRDDSNCRVYYSACSQAVRLQ